MGVNIQMMVFNPDGPKERGNKSKEVVLINPKIIKMGTQRTVGNEGCLSFYVPVVVEGDVEVLLSFGDQLGFAKARFVCRGASE